MARIKFQGLEEYEKLLSKISSPTATREVAGAAIYAGADVVANAIRESIQQLPEVDHRKRGSSRASPPHRKRAFWRALALHPWEKRMATTT